jgi:hypothetical protein
MGGDTERVEGAVERSPLVLKSADAMGRFAELTAIMGGERLKFYVQINTWSQVVTRVRGSDWAHSLNGRVRGSWQFAQLSVES